MSELVYLASPYTDNDPALMELRWREACAATAALMRKGVMVFSPIAHSHSVAIHGALPTGWDWWQRYDALYLERCSSMIVLTLAGWESSRGVRDEITIMQALGKPIRYMMLKDALANEEVNHA